jgi:hypothetical protein
MASAPGVCAQVIMIRNIPAMVNIGLINDFFIIYFLIFGLNVVIFLFEYLSAITFCKYMNLTGSSLRFIISL